MNTLAPPTSHTHRFISIATMAGPLVETWQSSAFQLPDYGKCSGYSAILSVLLQSESPRELCLRGSQPALKASRVGDTDLEVLCRTLVSVAQTHHLDLSYNGITDSGLSHLAEYLKDPSCTLETLSLAYNDIGQEGAETLSNALQFNSSLTSLCLDGCKIGHRGGISIASMLQVNRTISRLGLANTDLDTDCIIAMATVLHGNSTLHSVDLSRPLVHSKLEESTIHMARMLQVNCTLQELTLSKHSITDTGVEWICRHLRENTALLYLDISCNSLSRDGAGHLASLLTHNPPLSTLTLTANRIEDEGLIAISQALKHNTRLASLNVCSNSIGDKGLCRLAGALQESNSTLTHIYIWGNRLGEPTCNAFHALLESSRLLPDNTDVRPYEVDGVTYLARTG